MMTATTAQNANALVGVWHLESFHDIDPRGRPVEGPLGAAPRGLLFYSADGHVSVTMMRTGSAHPERPNYMSYAGTWRREGGRVVHAIDVAPDPAWLGTEQFRELALDGDLLTLTGGALVGPHQLRVLAWRRAGG
jgi:hypothetical protein